MVKWSDLLLGVNRKGRGFDFPTKYFVPVATLCLSQCKCSSTNTGYLQSQFDDYCSSPVSMLNILFDLDSFTFIDLTSGGWEGGRDRPLLELNYDLAGGD